MKLQRFAWIGLVTYLCAMGCRSSDKSGGEKRKIDYGQPIGARVTGNGKVPSFEIALAANGAAPDECLPKAVQAVSDIAAHCPAFAAEIGQSETISVTFQTKQGRLLSETVRSAALDDPGVNCVRKGLEKALSLAPHEQEVKYLLQVRPLAG